MVPKRVRRDPSMIPDGSEKEPILFQDGPKMGPSKPRWIHEGNKRVP